MQNNVKRSKLFADLGKATLRGLRKCPKCGTLNGIRGVICKNKACNSCLRNDVFAVSTKRKLKSGLDCVKLVAEQRSCDIFSIRVRERGPDYRGFVEVPAINGLDASSDPSLDTCFIRETASRCLVDCCRRESLPLETACMRDTNTLHSIETNITLTIIASCIHAKEAVRCEEDATPLRINSSLVDYLTLEPEMKDDILNLLNSASSVECPWVQRVSETNFAIKCEVSSKHSCGYLHSTFITSSPNRYSCACKQFKSNRNQTSRKCKHYYLCILSFMSNQPLIKEFLSFIQKEVPNRALLEDLCLSSNSTSNQLKPPKKETNEVMNSRKHIDRKLLTESDVKISFIDWLSSVTELINQTMHYQLSGKPDPLIFLTSHQHFDCLQQRIANFQRKKSLPNLTTVFRRKECPPLGTFTKFTYLLTNIMHVKAVFDTPKVCLMLTQKFIQKKDGNYEYLHLPESFGCDQTISDIYSSASSNPVFIKPLELKTFLKVGLTSPDLKEPIPFIIEWIPDLLPTSKVGELRIQFQFGHRRNGQIEKRD